MNISPKYKYILIYNNGNIKDIDITKWIEPYETEILSDDRIVIRYRPDDEDRQIEPGVYEISKIYYAYGPVFNLKSISYKGQYMTLTRQKGKPALILYDENGNVEEEIYIRNNKPYSVKYKKK